MTNFLTVAVMTLSTLAVNSVAQTVSGTLKHIENFPSAFVEARNVDIWLPDGYNSYMKYPVLSSWLNNNSEM